MPSEDTKILEFNQSQKSDKAPFIIYADLQCLIEKIKDKRYRVCFQTNFWKIKDNVKFKIIGII